MSRAPSMDGSIATNRYDEHLFRAEVLFGSSVVTSYKSKDLTFVRNSAGNYTITLPKPYRNILGFTFGFQDASGAILFCVITSSTITTDGKVIVEVRTEAGTATDPSSGDKLWVGLSVSDSWLNDKFGG